MNTTWNSIKSKVVIIVIKAILIFLFMHSQCNVVTGQTRFVKMAVIISFNNSHLFSMDRVRPALDYAIEGVRNKSLLPNSIEFQVSYSDSHCNTKDAPVSAFNFYMKNSVDVFFGPVCDYSLAPVARYAPYWNIPVISPGGFAHDFGVNKSANDAEFPTLTRIGATFNTLAQCIINTALHYNWSKVKLIYDGSGHSEVMPKFCFLAGSALIQYVKEGYLNWIKEYEYEMYIPGKDDIEKILRYKVANNFSSKCYFR